jgi:RNA methyltransferase, TrmH family
MTQLLKDILTIPLKDIKKLKEKKFRDKTGYFVLEGPKYIMDAMEQGVFPKAVLLNAERERKLERLVQSLEKNQIFHTEMEERIFLECADTGHSQGAAAVFEIPGIPLAASFSINRGLVLFLNGVQDPGNVGSIMRSALAFGVKHILADLDTADFYNPKVLRSSAGAALKLNLYRVSDFHKQIPLFRKKGFKIMAAEKKGVKINELNANKRGLLMMGNESKGLAESYSHKADMSITIDHLPAMESLNVAVAASICMHYMRENKLWL